MMMMMMIVVVVNPPNPNMKFMGKWMRTQNFSQKTWWEETILEP